MDPPKSPMINLPKPVGSDNNDFDVRENIELRMLKYMRDIQKQCFHVLSHAQLRRRFIIDDN